MPHDEPITHDVPAQDTVIQAPSPPVYEPIAQDDEWLDEDEELPRRPRRRLLSPVPLALLGVLIVACGFIGGVLVEKGQTSSTGSSSAASSLAARFAALRGSGTGGGFSSGGCGGGRRVGCGDARPVR